eukprot:TRINITY_DN64834_c0_g1_i1.p1 TRINITY_DN64834_c0_g1~~TRINITY_DN64834_c0_g1_i1.p1  ORF type:complete len:308 (+),score=93.90 TRINITY_DN64834_c0_g1_i1:75-926(+)
MRGCRRAAAAAGAEAAAPARRGGGWVQRRQAAGEAEGSWNPVQRSGFRPMRRHELEKVVARLREERREHGDPAHYTRQDWAEALGEGADAETELLSEEQRAERLKRSFTRGLRAPPESDIPDLVDTPEGGAAPAADGLSDMVRYLAEKIVWETEEQYRQRVGVDDPWFKGRIPTYAMRRKGGQVGEDARFLQAKYVEFQGLELACWHQLHRRVVRVAAELFKRKLWAVRDIAYCDHLCFVYVDNRTQPMGYRAKRYAAKMKGTRDAVSGGAWGGYGSMRYRGS